MHPDGHHPLARPPAPRRVHYLGLGLVFLAVAVYGSLVPLTYQAVDFEAAVARFRAIPYLNLGVESRADWVANILLFVPLGFCGAAALLVDRRRWWAIVAAPAVLAGCVALSVAIEFTQIWFPPRTVSQNDIVAESIGGAAGVAIWLAVGRGLTAWARSYTSSRRPGRQVEWLLQAYLAGFLVYSALPLDLTIAPAELWAKYRQGRISLVPFADGRSWGPVLVFESAIDALVYLPLGMLAATALVGRGRRVRGLGPSVVIGTALAALIELGQVVVYSRSAATSDVLLGAIGVASGAALARALWGGRGAEAWDPAAAPRGRAWAWLGLAALYAPVLAAVFWAPYDFTTDGPTVRDEWRSFVSRPPLAALYAGTDLNAMMTITRKLAWFAPLGALLGTAASRSSRSTLGRRLALAAAMAMAVAVAAAVELGQLLLPSRVADPTDVAICGFGAAVGAAVAARLAPAPPLRARSDPKVALSR